MKEHYLRYEEAGMYMSLPQVLLLGNGLNRAYGGNSWEELITRIWSNSKISKDNSSIKQMPAPLQVVLGTNDHIDRAIKKISTYLGEINDTSKLYPSIDSLLQIGFDHILTTNYSYEIERIAYPNIDPYSRSFKTLMQHTKGAKISESRYLLHTYNAVTYKEQENKIWHIHGEARKPNSIILDHYAYSTLLAYYKKEFVQRKNKQAWREAAHEPFIEDSWLDAFVMGDVYTLGFSFDFSEIDMWWLLNRKKRENATHGILYFYEPSITNNASKVALLESLGAEICNVGFYGDPVDYSAFYSEAIADIKRRIAQKRGKKG